MYDGLVETTTRPIIRDKKQPQIHFKIEKIKLL